MLLATCHLVTRGCLPLTTHLLLTTYLLLLQDKLNEGLEKTTRLQAKRGPIPTLALALSLSANLHPLLPPLIPAFTLPPTVPLALTRPRTASCGGSCGAPSRPPPPASSKTSCSSSCSREMRRATHSVCSTLHVHCMYTACKQHAHVHCMNIHRACTTAGAQDAIKGEYTTLSKPCCTRVIYVETKAIESTVDTTDHNDDSHFLRW